MNNIQYTPEEIQMAEKDSFRFSYVARDECGDVFLFDAKPARKRIMYTSKVVSGSIYVSSECYPSVKPMECVALKDILNTIIE